MHILTMSQPDLDFGFSTVRNFVHNDSLRE